MPLMPTRAHRKCRKPQDLITAALKLDPENPDIPFAQVSLSLLKRDSDGSFRAAERLLSVKPRWPRAYDMLGRRYLDRLQPKPASELLLQGLALDPKRPLGFLLANLALASLMSGDIDANDCLGERRRAANPTNLYSLRWLACAYAKARRPKQVQLWPKPWRSSRHYSIAKVREWVDVVTLTKPYRPWFVEKIVPPCALPAFRNNQTLNGRFLNYGMYAIVQFLLIPNAQTIWNWARTRPRRHIGDKGSQR